MINIVTAGISSATGNYVQVTGLSTGTDAYYRINGVSGTNIISIKKTASDTYINWSTSN